MKKIFSLFAILLVLMLVFTACNNGTGGGSNNNNSSGEIESGEIKPEEIKPEGNKTSDLGKDAKIIFLHHSTGNNVWNGGVEKGITDYNTANSKNYQITEKNYPSGGGNYPYEYWNIWVNNKTSNLKLEKLTKDYDVIIWKHCYPVSELVKKGKTGDVTSSKKTLENYKLQYNALKAKMKEFPNTRFIVWTGAVKLEGKITDDNAKAMSEFVDWVKGTWDDSNDNIYIWDFYSLETTGNGKGLYLNPDYAVDPSRDSHPNKAFCKEVAPKLVNRIVNVIEGRGDTTDIKGK